MPNDETWRTSEEIIFFDGSKKHFDLKSTYAENCLMSEPMI
jgi:hypothetical protein